MRICTFNVNSVRARLEIVQKLVCERDIDVFCMQEIKTPNENFPLFCAEYECIVHGQKKLNGVAVCSKYPIEDKQVGFEGERDESRFIYALINEVHIINIYAPLGDKYGSRYEYKLFFYEKLFEFLRRFDLQKDKLIICGDFNISHTELDVWDESVWAGEVTHLPEERAIFTKFLDMGLIDVVREVYKDEKVFSFYDYRGGAVYKNQGLRLDYFLVTKPMFERLEGVEILTEVRRKRKPTPSDHVPLIAEFRV
ncbi:MAG: exodeoxyribonuclease III [Epsilonproteobacteria bacterium]|nr:exodeoxyribonuclease III [Campylobacterota bacterium]